MQINGLRTRESLSHDNDDGFVRAAGVDFYLDFLGIDAAECG